MLRSFILLSLLGNICILQAQSTEFPIYDNGLIYSKNTMSLLSETVDSLNQHFESCEYDKTFYSSYQTVATRFRLTGDQTGQLKQAIDDGLSIDRISADFPDLEIKQVLLIKNSYTDYQGIENVNLVVMDPEDGNSTTFRYNAEEYDHGQQIHYHHYDGEYYSTKSLVGLYLPQPLQRSALNDKVSYLIGYSNCMVDTSQLSEPNIIEGHSYQPWGHADYSKLRVPEKMKMLSHLRAMRVVGGCSQDESPRIHAMNITRLAAETGSWEVFLRAHLNIMNDNFARAADGSYAWGARQTYIRELEELGINVPDLIFGIAFRVSNPSQNHYYGDIGRLGRALAESRYLDPIYQRALEFINDETLDDFNRLIMVFLCRTITNYLEDENDAEFRRKALDTAIVTLPNHLKQAN